MMNVTALRLEMRCKAEKLRDGLAVIDAELDADDIQQIEWIRSDGARLVYHPPPGSCDRAGPRV